MLDEEEASSNEDCLDSNLEDAVEEANKENQGKESQVKEKRMKKDQKQKSIKRNEFILRAGKQPLRSIPLNVSNLISTTEETIRKDLQPYSGQDIELYSSDDENDEVHKINVNCCIFIQLFYVVL